MIRSLWSGSGLASKWPGMEYFPTPAVSPDYFRCCHRRGIVVSLMGIGEGARQAVVNQFKSLGANVIVVKAEDPSAEFEADLPAQLQVMVPQLRRLHRLSMVKCRFAGGAKGAWSSSWGKQQVS